MRIRVLGQQIPASLAVLAATEGAVAWLSMYAAGELHDLICAKGIPHAHHHDHA